MKRLSILLVLITLAMRGFAQQVSPPPPGAVDMPFFINFNALSNSPPNSGVGGEAGYYQVQQWPYYPRSWSYTNKLEVFIDFPLPPENAWLLEKQADGSLSPVASVTNLFWDSNTGFYSDQSFMLTTNQVHSLIDGSWYVEVNFGTSNYIGNLAPDYASATGPTASVNARFASLVITIDPATLELITNVGYYTAIARNNRTAEVVFDGSQSMDPFYLPMQYEWTGWTNVFGTPIFTSSKAQVTNVFALGFYEVRLQVDDSIAKGWPYELTLQVVTASQELAPLISGMRNFAMPKSEQEILIDLLSKAAANFDHGNPLEGCLELERYQDIVSRSHFDIISAFYLLQPAQEVIDAFEGGSGWL